MPGLTCPSCDDAVEMESNAYGVYARKNVTHTCPVCGISETR